MESSHHIFFEGPGFANYILKCICFQKNRQCHLAGFMYLLLLLVIYSSESYDVLLKQSCYNILMIYMVTF